MSQISFAQSVLAPSSKTDADFPEKSTIIQNHTNRTNLVSLSYATWSDPIVTFSENEDPDGIDVNLLGTAMKWHPKGILRDGENYSLSGQLDVPGSYLSISSNSIGVEGSASLGGNKAIDIISLGSNDVLLVEIELDDASCGLSNPEQTANASCDEPTNCQAIVSILVVAGQSAFNDAAVHGIDLDRTAIQIANRTNDVLRNSGVLNKRVRVMFHDTPYNIPGGVPRGEPISNLRGAVNSFWKDPIAQQLRDDYSADMVYYLGGWPEMTLTNGEAVGYDTPENKAFAIGNLGYSTHTFTAPHELAHLWGCYHDSNNSTRCPRGHKLNLIVPDHDRVQTVMHQGEGAVENLAIPYYSNSSVQYMNEPTGITNEIECANEVSESMCRFADFRDTKELEVLIVQDDNTPCHYGASLQASITFPAVGVPGSSVQSYEWRYSYSPLFSGSNSGTVFSNNPSAFLPASIHQFKSNNPITVYVQLEVTTSDGVVTTWIEAIELCPLIGVDYPIHHLPLKINSLTDLRVSVFPNPTSSTSGTIWLTSTKSTDLKVTLLNINGQHLADYKVDASQSAQPLLLPSNLPEGIYILNATDELGTVAKTTIHLVQ
ncbi:MAG: T9SS type A sorting domain-containing protein [Saprospiraceae bacterium]